jgi:hypothetical protein
VPVEQDVPALVPYLELEDGNTIVATDGADEIHPSPDGREVRAVWRRWARIGAKPGQLVDPGLVSEVTWRIRDGGLARVETLSAGAPVTIRSWRLAVPSTATAIQPDGTLFSGAGALLRVAVTTPWKADARIRATGDEALGRGARGYIPLHLTYVARDIHITPTRPATWQVTLQPLHPSVE